MHYKGAKENIWLVFITRGVNFKPCSINIFCLTNKNTENCKQFFHVTAYWLFINRSSDLSLIMQMWFMTILPTHHFPKKIESVQYNAALAITGTIKGSFSWKIVPEIKTGIFLSKKMGARRLCYSIKFFQLVIHPIFMIYYHQWEVFVDMLIRLIWSLANLNSRTRSIQMSLTNEIN